MEQDTIKAAQRGERAAYERLAREVALRLYPLAFRVVRDRDLADEALQRTLVAIWRELPKLREPTKFEAWSQRILLRFCADELRRSGRRQTSSVAELALSAADELDQFEALARQDQLEQAFRRLSAEHRAVLVLTYFQGLSGAQAAQRLGVSPGTVASRLHYALRALRASLEADNRSHQRERRR